MEHIRSCTICNTPINNRRCDAKTCSSNCRGRLFRANKASYTLIHFKAPNDIYSDIVINAFKANKGISQYLSDMVMNRG